ncbi:MAG: Flavodoxin-like protein [Naasia sp.]|jgi:multimeric flavodoxin WrbA|nr:Flavodoxin-like protein [Naasia sp.]
MRVDGSRILGRKPMATPLTALALVCTLSPSPAESSTELLARQVLDQLQAAGAPGSLIRVVDYDVKPGVAADMGDGDQWPSIRERVLAADILVLATPTWMGHLSSVAQRVLERLDAELSEQDDEGRPSMFGKVAVAAVVGNEDGAHQISAELFQALNDVGFTIPAQGVTYWNGQAMGSVDYKDLDETPEQVLSATKTAAANAVHLAALLSAANYPVPS